MLIGKSVKKLEQFFDALDALCVKNFDTFFNYCSFFMYNQANERSIAGVHANRSTDGDWTSEHFIRGFDCDHV